MTTAKKSEKDRVIVFDTTLRDGEQCPGATMSFEEKIEIAEMLDDMGVDVIEAGFPDHLRRRLPGGQRDRPPLQERGHRRPVAGATRRISTAAPKR